MGKTSLVRLILYSLSEAVPSMQGFHFKRLVTHAEIEDDEGETAVLIRRDEALTVVKGGQKRRFVLPFDLGAVKATVFGASVVVLGDNLLGCFYIDQDKGWTLLNRGKVIGGIRFSIEDLISGLAGGVDDTPLKAEVVEIDRKLKKYKLAADVVGYRSSLGVESAPQRIEGDVSKVEERRLALMARKSVLERSLRGIRKAQRDNRSFRDYVNAMKLRVRLADGRTVLITSEIWRDSMTMTAMRTHARCVSGLTSRL